MYLVGQITIDLTGSQVQLHPPANFFGGVANLLTRHSWHTQERMETYKLLALAQSANRALMKLGVNDVVRVSVGNVVIYEDLDKRPDDFDTAVRALEDRVLAGLNPDPRTEFDLVLRHDDGVLAYVIDLDFVREHRAREHPVAITVTAVPVELRRGVDEDLPGYEARISPQFESQQAFDEAQDRWKRQLESFLDQLAQHFRTNLRISRIGTDVVKVLPRRRDEESLQARTQFGYPLYGFAPGTDLAYILLWDTLWQRHHLRINDVYYGTTYSGNGGGMAWGGQSAYGAEAPIMSKGDILENLDLGVEAPSSGHSWLSDIGDFFSGEGGGGDGGDGGGGGGCGGGGCGGG